jgi:antirestriction protein ArdC
MKNRKKTYQDYVADIANKIKTIMEKNQENWKEVFNREGSGQLAINHLGNTYKGINMINLYMEQIEKSYKSHKWLTFNQIKKLNGKVIKGEKSTQIAFFTIYEKEKTATRDFKVNNIQINKGDKYNSKIPCPKFYNVFNLSQTDLVESQEPIKLDNQLNQIIQNQDIEIIHHEQGRAFYDLTNDIIKIPSANYFKDEESYKAVLIHELAHSTMSERKLNREVNLSCKKNYAKEELVAELSSAIMCNHLNIKTELKNHASYIKSWLSLLEENDFLDAVKNATKVIDYFLVDQESEIKKVA